MDEDTVNNKIAGRELALRQAVRGDKICGALFALEAIARSIPGGDFIAGTMQDWSDDEDDIRPY